MPTKVIILGGGVAGMSAAHELIERGFAVEIYEHRSIPGGKARSAPVPSVDAPGRQPLPGEHGFRFFPRFYKHLTHTMKRIPYGAGKTVHDNLVDTTRALLARLNYPDLLTLSRFPNSLKDWRLLKDNIRLYLHPEELGLSRCELDFFEQRLWQILTTCEERRLEEYDGIGWWEFIEADGRSESYKNLFGNLSRTLVAAQPQSMSAKTGGDILVQLLLDVLIPGGPSADRVLNGPTNAVWIYPWLRYLLQRGVKYFINARVTELQCMRDVKSQRDVIQNVTIEQTSKTMQVLHCDAQGITQCQPIDAKPTFTVQGDYYIAALPVEVMADLVTEAILAADPTLETLAKLKCCVASMTGIQFYLTEDVPLVHGHTNYIDSPWALTSISQKQFWPDLDLSQYGDGSVTGILSVDISDWQRKGCNGKKASECTNVQEIATEVWEQLKHSLNNGPAPRLPNNCPPAYIVSDISFPPGPGQGEVGDREPLLVNQKHTWHLRPEAFTRISNLFLASDYVRTNTDLATMEGANEAARRAVNGIIAASKTRVPYCKVWKLNEPWVLMPWRLYDRWRNRRGLPWNKNVGKFWSGMTKWVCKLLIT